MYESPSHKLRNKGKERGRGLKSRVNQEDWLIEGALRQSLEGLPGRRGELEFQAVSIKIEVLLVDLLVSMRGYPTEAT